MAKHITGIGTINTGTSDLNPNGGITVNGTFLSTGSGSLDSNTSQIFMRVVENGVTKTVAGTLTFNYKAGNLTIMPEFRLDKASADIFNKKNGTPYDMTSNVLLAATYHF